MIRRPPRSTLFPTRRSSDLIALGGGVVGDLTGFAAACYQRGVAFGQVPTPLLAQVDSAVGGKTAVNHPGGKNLIGAFHQPVLVVTDTRTLATLPARELRAGLAEVIKYGLICDAALFGWLEAHLDELLAGAPAALAHVIRRSCEIKAAIVGRDEREVGERALLRSEEHTSELQSQSNLVCRLLLEKKNNKISRSIACE